MAAENSSSTDALETAADPVFAYRFQSFLAGGYDALTAPVGWFAPLETVEGAAIPRIRKLYRPEHIAPSALEAAAAWAERQGSTALLVSHRGRLVFERYWQGTGRDTRFNPQSMSKTLVALLVGRAIADGHIASVDDPVGKYVGEWAADPRGRIRIADLLTMSGGLSQIGAGHGYAVTQENPAARQHFGSDFAGPALGLAQVDAPGSKWDYNNNETLILGLTIERATGRRYSEYLSERLWRPLGLADAALYMDRTGGFPMVSCCVFSRPVDWLSVGELLARRGMHGGSPLVPAEWVGEMLRPSPTSPSYGYQIWLGNQRVGGEPDERPGLIPWQSEPFAAEDIVFLHGHGAQRVWVVPSEELVIVRAGRTWPPSWDEAAIPNMILAGLAE